MTSISEKGSFSPISISGCQLWLDAADVNGNGTNPVNGTSVSTWRDKSGNGRNAVGFTGTGTYSSTGFNSRQTIQITPSGNMASPMAAGTLSTGFAIFVVFQKTGANNSYDTLVTRTVTFYPAPFDTYSHDGPNTSRLVGDGTNYSASQQAQTIFRTTTPTIYFINVGSSTPATWNESINGTLSTYSATIIQGTGAYGDTATSFYLGTRGHGDTKMTGNISEVIVYNTTLSTAQRQQIEGYLAWKWGIQGSLPGAHPNYSVSGYTLSPFPSFALPTRAFKATMTSPFFSAANIAGCQLWLDAADSSTITYGTGTSVASWRDKANNYAVANSSAAYQPVYSQGTIRFNGVTSISYLDIPTLTIGSSAFSIFFVGRNTSTTTQPGNAWAPHFFWPLSGNGSGALSINNWIHTNIQGVNNNINSTLLKNQYYLVSYTFGVSANFEQVYANGTSIGTYSKGSPYVSSLYRIGAIDTSSPQYSFDGNIGEIFVYNTALTTAQRQRVEGYLAWKWGIQSSLPGAHPNYSVNEYSSPFPLAILPTTPFKSRTNSPFFSPLSIAGSSFWFDGSDSASLVLSGSNVTTWNDKSGRGYHLNAVSGYANATVSSAYQNGLNVINFSGNGLYRAVANSAVYPQDVYIIVSLKSLTAQSDVLAIGPTNADNFNSLIFSEGTQSRWKNGSSYGVRNVFSTVDETSRGVLLIQWSIANNNYLLRRNGTLLAQSSSFSYSLPAGSIFQVGFRHTDITSANFSGYIGEILVYNTQLGNDQRQQVEGYLAWKWGIQSSLPGTHPNFSANGYIVTPFPSFIISATPPVDPTTKYSALFNAANNPSLTIPANSALTLGTNNHTIEFWMYQTSRNTYAASFCYGNTAYFATNNYFMDVGESGFGFVVGNGSGGWAVNVNGGAARSLNTWLHYAIVRNGNTFTLYIDGISVGSGTSSINITAQGDVFRIGNTTTYPITGYISNFRVVNGTAVYTSNFNPPTSPLTAIPNTQLLLQGLTDRGPNAFTITNNGSVTLSTSISPFA